MSMETLTPLKNIFEETFFNEVNFHAFANASSEDILSPHFSSYLEEEEALFLIVGTDSGLLKKFFEKKHKHKFAKFVFVDFRSVIERTELEEDSYDSLADEDRNFWIFTEDFSIPLLKVGFSNYILRRKVYLIKSLAVLDSSLNSPYRNLWEKFEVDFTNFLTIEFNGQNAKIFEEQRLLNAAYNQVPASVLGRCLEGMDALILGGGPTLDDAIPWIKNNQGRFIIFAAARIADRMLKEGIKVDFFVTVDPYPWSFDNSKGMFNHSDESILIHSFHAQHRLISQWNGLSCYLGQKFAWKDTYESLNIDGPGPTVTNTALHIAVSMGADRVFLSGIDFCFANGKTHESGSNEAKLSDTLAHSGKEMLEDNSGQMTETRHDFFSAKRAMEASIKHYSQISKTEFVSLGLHSAKMELVNYIPMNEIQLCKSSKNALMESISIELTLAEDELVCSLEQSIQYLKKQSKRFKSLVKYTRQAMPVIEKLFDKEENVIERHGKKIKKLRNKVNKLVANDGDFFANYQSILFADAFKPVEDEMRMTNDEVKEQLKAYFKGIELVSESFETLILSSEERCKYRLKELNKDVLPSELYDQWKKWDEPGRAVSWLEFHDTVQLSLDEKSYVDKAIDVFNYELGNEDHAHVKMLEDNINNVAKLLSRANHSFYKKDLAELKQILEHVESLDTHADSQKEDFEDLIKGMCFELEGKLVEAFNTYEPITTKALRHIALKKMLPIAMNIEDNQAALIVLERLVAINLDYMVPYADMLKILGQVDGAIEVLNMYLSQGKSNSLSVKNKLAQLYIENQQLTEAKVIIDEVLKSDIDNKAALALNEILLQNQS